MINKKLKVSEIAECINQLVGGSFQKTDRETVKLVGFCNESTISEGIRRISNRVLKKLSEIYPSDQFTKINQIEDNDDKTKEDKAKKVQELWDSEVSIDFEELPDWEIMNKRLEENKTNLSINYVYLFERIFLNY